MFAVDVVLFVSAVVILFGSIALSIKMRFIQITMLPQLVRSFFISLTSGKTADGGRTVVPHKALFTAMSTTLGISTMISPVIAIKLGGPGALIGYLVSTLFGAAATFSEVALSLKFRKRTADGTIMGGPMQYLADLISAPLAKWYALSCGLLMAAWCGAQSNQLAAILSSPQLGSWAMPKMATGAILALFVICFLIGGIKWIAELSGKLVPLMFTLYLGTSLWIVASNIDLLPHIFSVIMHSFLSPSEFATGVCIGGLVSSLRWGVFKGVHSNEAGLGTQTIPHSMAETDKPYEQATLAMASTYTAGFIAILSGLVALISDTWQNPHLTVGIDMVAASFQLYFAEWGFAIIAICATLFGLGTVLGNCFNGTHCFQYLTKNRYTKLFYVGSAVVIF